MIDFDPGMPIYGLNFSNRRHRKSQNNGDITESLLIGLTTRVPTPNNSIMVLEMDQSNLTIEKLCEI